MDSIAVIIKVDLDLLANHVNVNYTLFSHSKYISNVIENNLNSNMNKFNISGQRCILVPHEKCFLYSSCNVVDILLLSCHRQTTLNLKTVIYKINALGLSGRFKVRARRVCSPGVRVVCNPGD